MVIGILLGSFFKDLVPYISFIGKIYVWIIRFLSVPIIFFSLITILPTIKAVRYGSFWFFIKISFILTVLAVLLAAGMVCIFLWSDILSLGYKEFYHTASSPIEFKDVAIKILKGNILLYAMLIAVISSYVLSKAGESKKEILNILMVWRNFLFAIVGFFIKLSPFGILALIASSVSSSDINIFPLALKIVGVLIGAYALYYTILLIIVSRFGKVSFKVFMMGSGPYQMQAFVSGSSKLSLPTALDFLKNNMKVEKNTADLVLPIASAINMQGLSIYIAITTLIFMKILGQDITVNYFLIIAIFATFGAIGVAGVNGGGIIILPLLLSLLRVPLEYISIIYMIDPIINGVRSAINITGDSVIVLLVNRYEKNNFSNPEIMRQLG